MTRRAGLFLLATAILFTPIGCGGEPPAPPVVSNPAPTPAKEKASPKRVQMPTDIVP